MAEEREYSDAEIDEIERTEYKEEQIAFYETFLIGCSPC